MLWLVLLLMLKGCPRPGDALYNAILLNCYQVYTVYSINGKSLSIIHILITSFVFWHLLFYCCKCIFNSFAFYMFIVAGVIAISSVHQHVLPFPLFWT